MVVYSYLLIIFVSEWIVSVSNGYVTVLDDLLLQLMVVIAELCKSGRTEKSPGIYVVRERSGKIFF